MRVGVSLAACALLIAMTIPVTAADPPDRRFAIGGGYAGSTIGVEIERDEDDSLTTSGFGILGRARWGERWGLQLRLVQGDESLGSGGEFSLGQVAVHPYFVWLESEQRYLHAYAKFGVAWTEFDGKTPSGVSFSDKAVGPSIGVGLEWGPPKYAFLFDFSITFVDIRLAPGEEENVTSGTTLTGFVFRF